MTYLRIRPNLATKTQCWHLQGIRKDPFASGYSKCLISQQRIEGFSRHQQIFRWNCKQIHHGHPQDSISRSRSRKQEAPVGLQGWVQVTANREAIHPLRKWGQKPTRPSEAKGARDRHKKPFAIIVPSFSMFCVCLQLPRSQQYLSGRMSGLA